MQVLLPVVRQVACAAQSQREIQLRKAEIIRESVEKKLEEGHSEAWTQGRRQSVMSKLSERQKLKGSAQNTYKKSIVPPH